MTATQEHRTVTWSVRCFDGVGAWFDARWEQRRADERQWRRDHA